MLVLGIILLVLVAVAVVGVVANGTSQDVAFNTSVVDVTTQPVWVFLAGAIAMLVTLIGLSFIRRGTRRRVERRREMKRLRKVEQEHVSGPIPVTETGARTETETETEKPSSTPASAPVADAEPDRQLVREPGRQSVAAPSSSPEAASTPEGAATTEDPARHREP